MLWENNPIILNGSFLRPLCSLVYLWYNNRRNTQIGDLIDEEQIKLARCCVMK